MKRFYVSKLIEVTYPATGQTMILPAIWNQVPAWVQIACPDAGYSLVLAAGPDHTTAVADSRNIPLWDITLDTPLSIYKQQERKKIQDALNSHGVNITINWNSDTFRDFLQRLGTVCEAAFDTNNFDIADPT